MSSSCGCVSEATSWFFSFPVQGNWIKSSTWNTIPDPLNGESFIKVAEVNQKEIKVGSLPPLVLLLLYLKFNSEALVW